MVISDDQVVENYITLDLVVNEMVSRVITVEVVRLRLITKGDLVRQFKVGK